MLRAPGDGGTLIDVLDRVLDKGIVIDGWARMSVAGIDLVGLEVKVVEIPYVFRDRELGRSKFGRREIGQYLIQLGQVGRDKVLGRLR